MEPNHQFKITRECMKAVHLIIMKNPHSFESAADALRIASREFSAIPECVDRLSYIRMLQSATQVVCGVAYIPITQVSAVISGLVAMDTSTDP